MELRGQTNGRRWQTIKIRLLAIISLTVIMYKIMIKKGNYYFLIMKFKKKIVALKSIPNFVDR